MSKQKIKKIELQIFEGLGYNVNVEMDRPNNFGDELVSFPIINFNSPIGNSILDLWSKLEVDLGVARSVDDG